MCREGRRPPLGFIFLSACDVLACVGSAAPRERHSAAHWPYVRVRVRVSPGRWARTMLGRGAVDPFQNKSRYFETRILGLSCVSPSRVFSTCLLKTPRVTRAPFTTNQVPWASHVIPQSPLSVRQVVAYVIHGKGDQKNFEQIKVTACRRAGDSAHYPHPAGHRPLLHWTQLLLSHPHCDARPGQPS